MCVTSTLELVSSCNSKTTVWPTNMATPIHNKLSDGYVLLITDHIHLDSIAHSQYLKTLTSLTHCEVIALCFCTRHSGLDLVSGRLVSLLLALLHIVYSLPWIMPQFFFAILNKAFSSCTSFHTRIVTKCWIKCYSMSCCIMRVEAIWFN